MPGPVDPSVLMLQATHRSVRAWEGSTSHLVTRQHYQASTRDWQVDERVLELVDIAGFIYIHRLLGGGLELDRALITALVEMETRDSHLPSYYWGGEYYFTGHCSYTWTAH